MNTATKQTNIKHIPTELNYFYHTHRMIKRLRQQGNTSRLIILALIIWNIILSVQVFTPTLTPHFTDKDNQIIMQLEDLDY